MVRSWHSLVVMTCAETPTGKRLAWVSLWCTCGHWPTVIYTPSMWRTWSRSWSSTSHSLTLSPGTFASLLTCPREWSSQRWLVVMVTKLGVDIIAQVSDKKLEKMFDQVQQWERPFTPNQVALLKKVVNKFKSKVEKSCELQLTWNAVQVRGPGEEEDKSPLIRSRAPSPRNLIQQTLAIPSISTPLSSSSSNSPTLTSPTTKPTKTWKFLRKTSQQVLGIPSTNVKVKGQQASRVQTGKKDVKRMEGKI